MFSHSKRGRRIVLIVSVLVFGSIEGRASFPAPPSTLNPTTYPSASGKYALYVNPSDPQGRGKGAYRLTLDGRAVWSGEKPYTLWQAGVADDGSVAGYAYSFGPDGSSEAGHKAGPGDFRLVILDPHGKERLDQTTKREDSRFLHSLPTPLASGFILDPVNDRVVFRVSDPDFNRNAESWRVYQLSTGKELATFRPRELMPDPKSANHLMDAKPVAGTTLTLIRWSRYRWDKERRQGVRFTLVGPEGKAIWSLDLVDDYETPEDEAEGKRVEASIRRSGGILRTDQAGRFELRFVKAAQRVTFRVDRAPSGDWSVSEIERRPFVEPRNEEPIAAEIPTITPRPVGRIVLKSPSAGAEPEICDLRAFVVDASGRIAFIRMARSKPLALMVVDQEGKVLHSVPLDDAHAEGRGGWSDLTCLGPGSCLLVRDDPRDRNRMEGAIVEFASGKVTPIPGFSTTVLSKFAGFPDGGFVVAGGLTYGRGFATGDDTLKAFDGRGKLLWELQGNHDSKDQSTLFTSPQALASTTDGRVALLDGSRKLVQFFDRSGKHHHTIDLKKTWGREPNYLSNLSADCDGGVVIEDSRGVAPIVRMKVDGTVRAQMKPRFKDGQTVDVSDAQVAPDGALWVSDGHALYRLTEAGIVDRALGDAPDSRRLNKVAAVSLDEKGRIYAVEGRTGAVHVFEPDGRWIQVCLPDPSDVPQELSRAHLTVSDAGEIALDVGETGSNRYLRFSAEGKRIGIEAAKLDVIQEKWYAQPRTGQRWVLGYTKVYLVDEAGAVTRTITRRADEFWLISPHNASVAADGSIAVISPDQHLFDDSVAVSLYSARGEPIRTFRLPPPIRWSYPRIAYDGKHVAVAGEKAIALFDVSGKALGQFAPPREQEALWTPFLSPDQRTLLLFDGIRTLHRFELR